MICNKFEKHIIQEVDDNGLLLFFQKQYKGGALGTLSREAKFLNRTQKYKVIALKKIKKKFFKDVTRGDPWASSLMKQNLNRT